MERSIDLLAPLISRPWVISGHHFALVQSQVSAALAHLEAGLELSDFVSPRSEVAIDDGGNATIHISGALADKAPPIWEKLGHTDYRSIRTDIDSARAQGATSLTLLVDSPGGSVSGLAETSAAIQGAAEQMPVHAHCDGMACSAGYWLASSADTISATPSSDVGNIGVVMVHADDSGFLSNMGIELNVLTNEGADLKGTFREPLSESQRDFLQQSLNETGAQFRSHVEGAREGIDAEVFRAGWYAGDTAQQLGLIDSIV